MGVYLEKTMERLNSGKDYLQNHSVHSRLWSCEIWKSTMARGGGNKKRFQYYTDSSGQSLYLRALQGHSGRSLIDPILQDNVSIPNDFFEYMYQVGCAINLHSIMNSRLIPGRQNLSKRQTVFFTSLDSLNKEDRDPEKLTWKHRVLLGTSRKRGRNIKTRCIGSISNLLKRKIKFLSNAIERRHPLRYTPSLLYPESRPNGNWRNQIRKSVWITSTASEDFLGKWLDEGIGFRSCSTTRRRSCSTCKSSQPTQLNPNPIYRTERPVVTEQTSRWSAQEIDTRFSLDCTSTNLFVERLEKDKDTDKDVDADRDRTGRPVVIGQPTSSSTQFEEMDIDFRVSGLWNKPKILVFVSSWRRSRVTLIDKIFKPINNKIMPTTHLVKNQNRWLRTWAM